MPLPERLILPSVSFVSCPPILPSSCSITGGVRSEMLRLPARPACAFSLRPSRLQRNRICRRAVPLRHAAAAFASSSNAIFPCLSTPIATIFADIFFIFIFALLFSPDFAPAVARHRSLHRMPSSAVDALHTYTRRADCRKFHAFLLREVDAI